MTFQQRLDGRDSFSSNLFEVILIFRRVEGGGYYVWEPCIKSVLYFSELISFLDDI